MRKVFLLCLCLSLQSLAFGKSTVVTGMACEGGELSERSETICQKGQWLIAFDDAPAFVAKLRKESVFSMATYFEIVPKDHMTHSERKNVGRFWMRVGLDQMPEFLRRGVNGYPEL